MLFESFYACRQNSLASERGIVGIKAEIRKFPLLRYQISEFLEKLGISQSESFTAAVVAKN
jgi:hypothetical protein